MHTYCVLIHPSCTLRPPALLEVVFSLSLAPGLLPVLGDLPSTATEDRAVATAEAVQAKTKVVDDGGAAGTPPAAWRKSGLGGKLMSSCISMLEAPNCSEVQVISVVSSVISVVLRGA